MNGKHFTFEDKMIIASGLSHDEKCTKIAESLGCDPTSVSQEIKRNRIDCTRTKYAKSEPCPITKHYPFVCGDCKFKYKKCEYHQFKYDAKFAQSKAESQT